MTQEELEDILTSEATVRIYTLRLGRFIEGRVSVLHWPAAPDAFLLEAISFANSAAEQDLFYMIQRSDPSLVVERAEAAIHGMRPSRWRNF